VRLLALSFVLFFVLTAALGTVFWRVERVNATAAAARAATIQSCASDNVQRAESLRLWTYVLSELPARTASERATNAGFLEGLTDIYSQSLCPTH
jgi:hypothetical protein